MQTLEKFVAGGEVRLRCQEVDPEDGQGPLVSALWTKHYRCELYGTNGDRPITTIVGSDDGPPELADVLDAVAAETAVVDAAESFEAWAVQMGFDPDSRHGEREYRAWRRRAAGLRKLLGDDRYQQLLWRTERL